MTWVQQVKEAVGNAECTPCSSGEYRELATEACRTCQPGWVSPPQASACTSCGDVLVTGMEPNAVGDQCLCAPGWFVNNTGAGATPTCAQCPTGTMQAAYHRLSCGTCAAGYYPSPNRTACWRCAPNTVSAPGWDTCMSCAPGEYIDIATRTCKPCAAGTAANVVDATSCARCDVGSVALGAGNTKCTKCPPGTRNDHEINTCIPCVGGTYSSSPGLTTCTSCATGHITLPEADDDGTGTELGLANGARVCVPCNASTFAVRGVECRSCPFNQYSGDAASSCTPCPTGTWSHDGLTCNGCPPGTFQSGQGKECDACPSGQANGVWNVTSCTSCPAFSVPTKARDACAPCPAGTFALGTWQRFTACWCAVRCGRAS